MKTRFSCLVAVAGFLLNAPESAVSAGDNKTQELMAVLQAESSLAKKAQACQRLGEYGSAEAVPALAALLQHEVLSTYARAGLERIPHPSATEALRTAIGTTQGNQLVGVINSLGTLRDAGAVELLSQLTAGSEPEVVEAALRALGRISNSETMPLLQRALTSEALGVRSAAAAACLIAAEQQLKNGESEVAGSLYDALRQAELPASYRIGAMRGAIIARQPDHIPLLLEQLRSNEQALRHVALLTIREIPSDALAAALNQELTQAPTRLQVQLITAMQDCHNPESLKVILAKIDSTHRETRMAAITVLSAIGGPPYAPALLDVLKDPRSRRESSIVMASLSQMPGTGVDEKIVKAISSVSAQGPRMDLIRLVELRQINGALDELMRQAADPEPKVRIAAFRAMGSMVGPDNVPQLIALTRSFHDEQVRSSAEQTLYRACLNTSDSEPAADIILGELQHATDPRNKMSWTRVLTSLGYAKALSTVANGLRDTNRDVVANTITQLGKWPDPTPIEMLFKVVEDAPNQANRKRALLAVIQLATTAADEGQRSDEVLVEWFKRANRDVESVQEKRLFISGLGRVPHVESIRLLDPYLEDSDVRNEAVVALVEVAQPLAKGEDYAVVQSVLERLSEVQDASLRRKIANLQHEIRASQTRHAQP